MFFMLTMQVLAELGESAFIEERIARAYGSAPNLITTQGEGEAKRALPQSQLAPAVSVSRHMRQDACTVYYEETEEADAMDAGNDKEEAWQRFLGPAGE